VIILIYSRGYKFNGINEPILKDRNKNNKELKMLIINWFLIKWLIIKEKLAIIIILGSKIKRHLINWIKLIKPILKEFKIIADKTNWKKPTIIEYRIWDIKYSEDKIGKDFIKLLLYNFIIQLKFNINILNKTETNKIPEHTHTEYIGFRSIKTLENGIAKKRNNKQGNKNKTKIYCKINFLIFNNSLLINIKILFIIACIYSFKYIL